MSRILRAKNAAVNSLETATETNEKTSSTRTRKGAMSFLTAPLLKKIKEEAHEIEAAMIDRSASFRAKILVSLREVLKQKLTSDKDMWLWVKTYLNSVVDALWTEITVEIDAAVDDAKQDVLGNKALDAKDLPTIGDTPRCCSPEWMRAKILYVFLPYDKSIFGQMRDCFWWVLLTISIWPTYGVSTIFFAFLFFLLICKSPPDEFQLIFFILQLKGMQFISGGIICAFIGAGKYYWCVQPGGMHSCDVDGPYLDPVFGCVDMLGSCVLVWLAFLVLPFTEKAGGMRQAVVSETPAEGKDGGHLRKGNTFSEASEKDGGHLQRHSGRGGRLHALLRWDLLCFVASCIFLLMLLMRDYCTNLAAEPLSANAFLKAYLKVTGSWRFREALYWAKVFYALLSIPFSIFYLPGFQTVLTHSIATGFNANGTCVVFMMDDEDQHETPDDTDSRVEELTWVKTRMAPMTSTTKVSTTTTSPTDESNESETESSSAPKQSSATYTNKQVSFVFQIIPHKIIQILETQRQRCFRTATYILSIPGMLIRTPKTVMKAFLGEVSKLFDKLPLGMVTTCNVQDRIHQLEKENLEKQIQALSQETKALKKNSDVRDSMHQLEKEKLEKQIQALSKENQALKELVQETEIVSKGTMLSGAKHLLHAQLILLRVFLRFLGLARSS